MPGERPRASTGGFRRLASGTGLLAVGTCVGIVVGTVWNVPELLIERLRRPVQIVELAPVDLPGPPDLPEFRSLQGRAPQRSAVAPVAPAPRTAPAKQRSPAPTPARPTRAAAAPSQTSAQTVIAGISRRTTGGAPSPSGKVVQVAAYTDARSAEALVRRLRERGYDSFVSSSVPQGKLRFRVRVRPARGQEVAQLAEALGASGYGVWITRE
jgi:cell division septation protein DedD